MDWDTWLKYKDNIFFQIIAAGRVMLKAPFCYIADNLVMHTWFNRVYWHRFGKNQIDIEFNLACDRYQCMAAILYDHPSTPAVTGAIRDGNWAVCVPIFTWPTWAFMDPIKAEGLRPALRRLNTPHALSRRERQELGAASYSFRRGARWAYTTVLAARLPGVRPARELIRKTRLQA